MADEKPMVIIAGHYLVDAEQRDAVVAASLLDGLDVDQPCRA